MITKISIWNMALGFIGTRTIASETENTLEAVQCALYWNSARRQALRDFPWNFAQRRAWLAEIPIPEGYEQHCKHAYTLPHDCLQALAVYNHGADNCEYFFMAHDGQNGRPALLCNMPKALLSYTADIEDANLFDDLFAHMLARKLAALVATALLKNNITKMSELEQLYRASIPNALQANAKEGNIAEKKDSWLASRA